MRISNIYLLKLVIIGVRETVQSYELEIHFYALDYSGISIVEQWTI